MPEAVTKFSTMAAMDLDINTLFMVTMHIEIMLGLLLFFAWAQSFAKRALAWWGCAHLMRAVSIMMFGLHGSVPDSVSIDGANAVLFASFALTWSGARVFDRREAAPIWGMVGVAVWLFACRLPQFSASAEAQAIVGSAIVAAYTWLTAYELWRGRAEALVSRWPAIFMLFAHGALFLLRTPLGVTLRLPPRDSKLAMSGWLELLSVEALLFTISIAFMLLAMAKERTEYRHRAAARTDSLTGIANRRGLLEQAVSRRSPQDAKPIAVLLFDLDHFKSVNDRFGHAVGDRALQIFADTAQAQVGSAGMVGRWGGDEFVAVLHDTTRERAAQMAERIQTAFEKAATEIDGDVAKATVSTGMVFSANGALDLPALLVQADQALYRAKQGGRNRVSVAQAENANEQPADAGKVVSLKRRSAA